MKSSPKFYRQANDILLSFFFISFLLLPTHTAKAGAAVQVQQQKPPAILLVAFGTSVKSAQVAFQAIDKQVKAAFPKTEVRWAYTSSVIRNKLAKNGTIIDSPEIALARLMAEGYSKVVVQSLHIIPGEEFDGLKTNAEFFSQMVSGFKQLKIGSPLLMSGADLDQILKVVTQNVVPKERQPGEAIVLMGHGTSHPSNAIYEALMYRAQQQDANIYIATVEGSPSFAEIKTMLAKKKIKKAYLIPLMSVAGDHAINDMAGSEDYSLKKQLEAQGIQVVPVLKGLAEFSPIVEIWIEHLQTVMEQMK